MKIDDEIYSPEMSFVEYWRWAKEHDPKWRHGIILTCVFLVITVGAALAAIFNN